MVSGLESNIKPKSNSIISRWLFGVLSVSVALFLVFGKLDQGWMPHDEGQLGQAAERVLAGELPHRDFDDMYTGALSYVNAISFKLWGVNSLSMRWMLFAWFAPFLIAMFWLMSEFAKPSVAAMLTLLIAAWSIPMYSAPMPSWYNLFFAGWTACALMQFIKKRQRRYLLLAGLLIGSSVLFKISGVFVFAGALLFLFYFRQTSKQSNETSRLFSGMASLVLFASSLLSLKFVSSHDLLMQSIHFAIPFIALVWFVIYREWNLARGNFKERFLDLAHDGMSLGAGLAIPIVGFVAFYVSQDAIGDLAHGALVLPTKRVDSAAFPFPEFNSLVMSLPILGLMFAGLWWKWGNDLKVNSLFATITGVFGIGLLCVSGYEYGFKACLLSFRNLIPFVVIGNLILLFKFRHLMSPRRESQLYLLTSIPFFVSLIQYPFAAPIYFFYAAPLLVVTALIGVEIQPWVPRRALAYTVVFQMIFCALWLVSPVTCLAPPYKHKAATRLTTERCQVVVDTKDADAVNRLYQVVTENSAEGETVFATPDIPEVSYLCNRPALNGVMYEFFRDGLYEDLAQLRQELTTQGVRLVVINELPQFSEPVDDKFRSIALADFVKLESILMNVNESLTVTRYTVYQRRDGLAAVGE